MPGVADELIDAAADLLLGSACVACARPGRPLCRPCRTALPGSAVAMQPTPCPAGLAPSYATGPYDDALRSLVVAHKERRLLSLASPLGGQLATAVATALRELGAGAGGPVVLVPVPSRGTAVRERGHDPTLAMTRRAARHLTRAGRPASVARLLRLRPGVADQAGLTAELRRANLERSMAVRPRPLTALSVTGRAAHLVVCDDVLTTGATAREAQRALEAVGASVLAVATVAATRRRGKESAPPLSRLGPTD